MHWLQAENGPLDWQPIAKPSNPKGSQLPIFNVIRINKTGANNIIKNAIEATVSEGEIQILHHGLIHVQCKKQEGTTFIIELPVRHQWIYEK